MKGRKPNKKDPAPSGENISATAPEWLNQTAAKIWAATILQIEEAGGHLPLRFVEIFTGYCLSAATAREADEVLTREGPTVCDGRAGTRRHPLVSVRAQALLQLRGYAESLGLTPGSSARLPVPEKPRVNDFAEF